MVGESFAIIAVVLVMAAMFAQSGRRLFASFTLPLVSVPVFHLLGALLQMRARFLVFDTAGLALGILLCLFFSRAFPSRRGRVGYLVFCCGFLVALYGAYLLNMKVF